MATMEAAERPERTRMQGAEQREFISFLKPYGVSDAVMRLVGNAFDIQAGYADRGVVTGVQPLHVLLSYFARGFDEEEARYGSNSLPMRLARTLELSPERVEEVRHRYLASLQRGEGATPLRASPELVTVMDRGRVIRDIASRGETYAARHLFAALLEHFERDPGNHTPLASFGLDVSVNTLKQVLQEHVKDYSDDDAFSWQDFFDVRGPRPFAFGRGLKIRREASDDEVCLDADGYADVLAELFSKAEDGEFCFALFGHWGRGKTFLMRRVAKALAATAKRYQVIEFSAWRYPSTPEVWVHLYETVAAKAFGGPLHQRLRNTLRTAMERRGTARLLWAYALLALSVVPLTTWIHLGWDSLRTIYLGVGLGGLWLLVSLFTGVRRVGPQLMKDYLTAPRHAEKLGLQATIGTDLRALLVGWMPKKRLDRGFIAGICSITALLMAATWARLTGIEPLNLWLDRAFGLEPFVRWGATEIGWLLAAIALAAGLFLAWLGYKKSSPDRVLLVVDDLDRCTPSHLLTVMESIKLLVEDEAISSRVQVVMLIEEDVLKHAILEKYKHLAEEGPSSQLGSSFDARRLVRENCEKLFSAHLRMPKLSKAEVIHLVDSFSGQRKERETQLQALVQRQRDLAARAAREPQRTWTYIDRPAGARRAEETPHVEIIEYPQEEIDKQQRAIDEERKQLEPELAKLDQDIKLLATTLPSRPTRKDPDNATDRLMEKAEVEALIEALSNDQLKLRDDSGPRAVRAFLFRYQLARLLLNRLGIEWRPEQLAAQLCSQLGAGLGSAPRPPNPESSNEEQLARVVEQVS